MTFFSFNNSFYRICNTLCVPKINRPISPLTEKKNHFFFHCNNGVWRAYILIFKKIAMVGLFQKKCIFIQVTSGPIRSKNDPSKIFFTNFQSTSHLLSFDANEIFLLQKLAVLWLVKVSNDKNRPKTKMANISGCS